MDLQSKTSYQRMNITTDNTPEGDGFIDAEPDTDADLITNDVMQNESGRDLHLVNNGIRNNTLSLAFKEYSQNIYFISELLFCALLGGFGHSAPKLIFRMAVFDRGIPYQTTANGDIMLDLYLNRKLTDETIPDSMLVIFCLLLPFLIVLLFNCKFGKKNDLHSSACCFLFAFGCNEFITSSVKLYAGYWRPNFYSMCSLDVDNLECKTDIDEARKSFPSGHASSSFCGMTLFTLFFVGKLGYYSICSTATQNSNANHRPRNETSASLLFKKRALNMLAVSPMLLAVFISVSRVHDNMHHPADIVAGSIIGMLCAVFSYAQW